MIRITEGELKKMILESANKILSELDWRTYANAAKKGHEWREAHPHHRANQWNRVYNFDGAAMDAFNKQHGLEGQYDNGAYGGEKGVMKMNSYHGNTEFSGSRDHDFGDGGGVFNLNHNIYHMGKKYGKDGNYGRTRMWDMAHETTPEEFYGDKEMGKKFRALDQEVDDYNSGKTHYVKGKGWSNESLENKKVVKEAFQNNQNYSHFAVNKATNKIVNGWDYSTYNPSELRQFRKDYFDVDLIDNGLNPKNYKILTYQYLVRQGIDPNDNNNWSNR